MHVAYCLLNPRKHYLHAIPASLANTALSTYRLVHCRRQSGCGHTSQALEGYINFQVHRFLGKDVSFYRAPDERTLCATLAITELLTDRYFVVWNDECMQCVRQKIVAVIEKIDVVLIVSYSCIRRYDMAKMHRYLVSDAPSSICVVRIFEGDAIKLDRYDISPQAKV